MKKGIAALVCAGMITLTGCYGSNALFGKLHKWNGTLGNKWLNSIVHFFLMVIPVYPISLCFIDGLILNTVEFWTSAMKTSSAPSTPTANSSPSTTSKSNSFLQRNFGTPALRWGFVFIPLVVLINPGRFLTKKCIFLGGDPHFPVF